MAIIIPADHYKELCDTVFALIRESGRAYLFVDRQRPVVFRVESDRAHLDTVLSDARRYLFVAMYEAGARQQDVLQDAQDAIELIADRLMDPRPRTEVKTYSPFLLYLGWFLVAFIIVCGIMTMVLMVLGGADMLHDIVGRWFFDPGSSS